MATKTGGVRFPEISPRSRTPERLFQRTFSSTAPKIKSFSSIGIQNDANIYFGTNTSFLSGTSSSVDEESAVLVSLKQKLCLEMLVSGHVHSFVDFFYLTHANDNDVPDPDDEEAKNRPKELPDDSLYLLQKNLTLAESAARVGDSRSVVAGSKALALHFETLGKFPVAIKFHEKCLEVARSSGDTELEGKANESLGLAYQKLGDTPRAIQYFEEFNQLAMRSKNREEYSRACHHLVETYRTFSEESEARDDYQTSVEYLRKCLDKAKACHDLAADGLANYKLGLAYKVLNRQDLRIEHLQNYLNICRQTQDFVGEGIASSALAAAFEENSDVTNSIKFLEENIRHAERTGQTAAKAQSCGDLGMIYSKSNEFDRAVEYFDKYFQIASEMEDTQLMDKARVFLGIARGNQKVCQFLNTRNTPQAWEALK